MKISRFYHFWVKKWTEKKIRKIEIGQLGVGELTDFWRSYWLPPIWTKIKNRKYKISSNRNEIGQFRKVLILWLISKINFFLTVFKNALTRNNAINESSFLSHCSRFTENIFSGHRKFNDSLTDSSHSQLLRIWVWAENYLENKRRANKGRDKKLKFPFFLRRFCVLSNFWS